MRIDYQVKILAAAAALLAAAGTLPAVEKLTLDGLWDFRFEKGKTLEEVAFPAFEANDKMTVPGCWNAMSRYFNQHGTGCYRRQFALAADAVNAFLVVDGAGLRSRFWIDGREIGLSKLPWSRFEFATGPLAKGAHELVAAVDSVVRLTETPGSSTALLRSRRSSSASGMRGLSK